MRIYNLKIKFAVYNFVMTLHMKRGMNATVYNQVWLVSKIKVNV